MSAAGESSKRLDIQGLRALAVLLVICFHAGIGLRGGFVGVDVFFAISGYVITATLVRELERTRRIDVPAFYLRRIKRLLPALAALIVVVELVGLLAAPAAATHLSGMTGVFASFFGANLYLGSLSFGYFAVSTQLDPLLHTWTLAVEEQFYVVFPVLLLGAWWLGGRRRRARAFAMLVIAALGVDSLLVAERTVILGGDGAGTYYSSPARAWEFAAGALVALSAGLWSRLPQRAADTLGIVGVAGLAAAAVDARATSGLALAAMLPVAAGCAVLATGGRGGAARLLSTRPLTWVGDRSYSLYLWHWPLIVFARALEPGRTWAVPVAAAASVLPAWASYRFVENPVRRSGLVWGRRTLVVVAVCVAVPAAVSLGASRFRILEQPAYAAGPHADQLRDCDSDAVYDSPTRARCSWRIAHPRGNIVLIGDSNAGHFTEPFVRAATQAGFDATVATPSGCPFLQLRISKPTYDYGPCMRFNADALRELIRRRPNLVVIGARTDLYLSESDFSFGQADGPMTDDVDRKQQLWTLDLEREIAELNRVGVPVVVLHPVPALPTGSEDCAVLLLLTHECGGTIPRTEADRDLKRVQDVENTAVAGHRAWVVGFEDDLCPDGRCSSRRRNLILYRNTDHLSVPGALTLTGQFATTVIRRARGAEGYEPTSVSTSAAARSPERNAPSIVAAQSRPVCSPAKTRRPTGPSSGPRVPSETCGWTE